MGFGSCSSAEAKGRPETGGLANSQPTPLFPSPRKEKEGDHGWLSCFASVGGCTHNARPKAVNEGQEREQKRRTHLPQE